MTDSQAAAKKVNVGGYANFYTGTGGNPSLLPQEQRGRIWIYDRDIVDVLSSRYGIQMLDAKALEPEDTSKEAQNKVEEDKGIGVVYCSYVLGYALGWPFFRGLKRVIKVKKTDGDAEYEIETQRFEKVKPSKRVQLKFVNGVKMNAPELAQSKRPKGQEAKFKVVPVTQLSIGVPSKLIDRDGKYIRLSKKPVQQQNGEEGKQIGLGITENYFDEFLGKVATLEKITAGYNIVEETKANILQPTLDFVGSAELGEGENPQNIMDAQIIDAELIFPAPKIVWDGTSPGRLVGIEQNVIPMRLPYGEIESIFKDLL